MSRSLSLVATLCLLASPLGGQSTTAIKAARLIDGTGAAPSETESWSSPATASSPWAAQDAVAIPAGARTIDLGDATLLPGFIDAHTHIIGRPLGDPKSDDDDRARLPALRRDPSACRTRERRCSPASRRFATSARAAFDDMALRESDQRRARAIGPRMQNAGHGIGITGGHCDENGFRPGLVDRDSASGIADGPDEIARGGALSGQVRRGRHQDLRDRRRAVRGRRGRRAAVHARRDEGDGGRGHEARTQGRRPRARHRGHQDRGARGRRVDRARLVPRRGRRDADGAARHVSRADDQRRRGRGAVGEERTC